VFLQEPMKTKAPQLHMEYRFYRILGSHGMNITNFEDLCLCLTNGINLTSRRCTRGVLFRAMWKVQCFSNGTAWP
jgi:hypothetical protein